MKKYVIPAILILTILLPLQMFAQPKRGEGPRHKQMMEKLNLTDKQKEQVEKLRSDHQLKMIDQRAELQKLEVQLKDEKRKTGIDEDKILTLTKKIGDLRSSMQVERTEMWLKVYNLLDDKQKETWKEHNPGEMVRHERLKHKRGMRHEREIQ